MTKHRFPYHGLELVYAPGPFVELASSDLGRAMWAFLTQPHILLAMVTAVRLGAAPVSAISSDLLEEFGSGDPLAAPRDALADGLARRFPVGRLVALDTVKRMIGHMIRQILAALGLVLRTRNSPANDPAGIFSTAARYQWQTASEAE